MKRLFGYILLGTVILLMLASASERKRKRASATARLNAKYQEESRWEARNAYDRAKAGNAQDSLIEDLRIYVDRDSENGWWSDYAIHAHWLGELSLLSGSSSMAGHWYREEYAHSPDLPEQGVTANLHVNGSMAMVYQEMANEEEAIASLAKCKDDLSAPKLHPSIAHKYYSIYGSLLSSIGYHRDALEIYWITDSLLQRDPAASGMTGTQAVMRSNWVNLALTHMELDDPQGAIELARRILEDEREDAYAESANRVLARCYAELSRDSASSFRERAQELALKRTDNQSKSRVEALCDAAWAKYLTGARVEAQRLLEEAIQEQNTSGHTERMAFSLGLKGVLWSPSDPEKAEVSAQEALFALTGRKCRRADTLPGPKAFPDPVKAVPIMSFRSALYEALHGAHPDEPSYLAAAVRSADLALDLLERAGRSRNESERARLAAERWSAFESVVRINALAYKGSGYRDRRYAEHAFKAMELSKNFLAKGGGSAFVQGTVDPLSTLELKINRLAGQLEQGPTPVKVDRSKRTRRKGKRTVVSIKPFDQQKDMKARLIELITRRDSLIATREAKEPAWVLPTLGQVQQALPPDEVLVEYFNEKEKLYAIWVRNDTILFYKVDKMEKGLSSSINSCLRGMKAGERNEETTEANIDVYHFVLKRGLDCLKPKSLIVVPDGELCRIPFEALEYEAGHVLLEQHAVRYGYSASVVLNSIPGGSDVGNSYLGCAPVHFDGGESGKRQMAQGLNGGTLVAMRSRDLTDSLPNTKREVTAGWDLFGGHTLIDAQASEVNVLAQMKESRIIHFATHGGVDMLRPEFSFLLLADPHVRRPKLGELPQDASDNVLYAHEISRMKLRAELVVLSACNTGDGAYRHGQGIMSLARAFEDAGVQNVVMSLWPVQDASTATIMQDFLSLVKDGQPKHEALRQAKLNYRNAHVDADVNAWAPFVLIGDGEPITVAGAQPLKPWAVAFALVAITGLAFYWRRWRAAA